MHLCVNVFLAKAVLQAGFRLRGILLPGLRGTLQNTMTGKHHGTMGIAESRRPYGTVVKCHDGYLGLRCAPPEAIFIFSLRENDIPAKGNPMNAYCSQELIHLSLQQSNGRTSSRREAAKIAQGETLGMSSSRNAPPHRGGMTFSACKLFSRAARG